MRRFDKYDFCAAAIILLGTALRFILIALGWPAAYNDEGTLGLMARHIAYQGAHPLLYYGQDYLGSLEAYLGAGFFHLFGPSAFTLRLGLLLLFALFLLCMYLLTRLLYTKGLGLCVLMVLSLGAPDAVLRQLMAAGGTPELFFFTSLLLLLSAWLAFTSRPALQAQNGKRKDTSPTPEKGKTRLSWPRLLMYGAWGLVAGLDLWSHLLCLPFVLCSGLLLALFCRKELRLPSLSLLLLGLLLGLSPLFIYNATVPVSSQELSLFTGAFGGGYREPSYPPPRGQQATATTVAPQPIAPRPLLQVGGTFIVGIPVATSGVGLCPVAQQDAWPLSDQTGAYTRFCSAVHGAWSIGWLVLWFCAAMLAARPVWRYWRAAAELAVVPEKRQETIRHAARLMILAGAGLSVLAFMLYPQASAVTPWVSARYLVGLLLATPAVLFPLWEKRHGVQSLHMRVASIKAAGSYVLLGIVLLTCLLGMLDIFTQGIPQARADDQKQNVLISRLLQLGATRIYTNYEDCNRLAFLSNEKIVCAALDRGLQPGLDRYYPYRAQVASAPHPFYVFPADVVQTLMFEQTAADQHIAYRLYEAGGYMIFEPDRRIAP